IVVHDVTAWRYLDGVLVAGPDDPKKTLFNIRDVLEQGSVVIGMATKDVESILDGWGLQSGAGIRLKAHMATALERNK
ncbi:MAG: hypothetical protein V3V85_02440, partial [Candidatus Thorarchaeota archaeon]